ncbi:MULTISPECIES: hypothetical protein [unclassified Undibacterium]|uniref:hypothetical protein n=1 Tax=unclassified Undibacterium TaxID=2630295 RepID=UPI002AC9907B|nr:MULTISPECIES: hypothetical protein [unclassified Undibacterium]MEB0140655.1 hypothetical protein [Undibacterium sp. CCC2.1]MEB0172419.1 hypothetical protein [Undibacterium sp. CCC1.1]MEB0177691.1 hypothetical protein [Undibacterium sp. CCC3.4]MEB0215541.1 hypothetical protein [Undibacterium sp. 5I2]WPX43751.1 hypothetical protein RHM61_00485 [Undibacterium sp. CCC3.4]
MRIEVFQSMSSEIETLQELLDEIPAEDVIDRRSILARLEQAKARLPTLPEVESRERAKAILSFRGRPVVGTHGIRADFGTKATSMFVDAVAAIAASFDAPLKATGPIRDRNENQLLITGTAIGSFGFELEASAPSKLLFEDRTNVELALARTITLFEACVNHDDEALADNIDDLDKRALGKVRDFVMTLVENEATCALSFEKNTFLFQNNEVVKRTANRLSHDITTMEKTLEGAMSGLILSRRTFEFTGFDGELIVGKIGLEISEPASLKALIDQRISVQFTVTQVSGSRPRYVLKQVFEPSLRLLGGS